MSNSNWEDDLISESAGNGDETPIFTGLYLEYREAAFRRIGFKLVQEEGSAGEPSPGEEGKDSKREAAIQRAQEEDRQQ